MIVLAVEPSGKIERRLKVFKPLASAIFDSVQRPGFTVETGVQAKTASGCPVISTRMTLLDASPTSVKRGVVTVSPPGAGCPRTVMVRRTRS